METISPSGSLSHTHILFLTSSGGGGSNVAVFNHGLQYV